MIILYEGSLHEYKKITGTVVCNPEWYHLLNHPNLLYEEQTQEEFDINLHCIYQGQVIQKPTMNLVVSNAEVLADGIDITTISNVPVNAEITSNDKVMIADGNDIEFVTDIPGEHRLQIRLWPYQAVEVTIHAI